MKYKLVLEEMPCSLLLVVGGKRYLLSQASGELVASDGHGIGDLYWSNPPESCREVKNIFRSIAQGITEVK